MIFSIIIFIFTLLILVVIHELGHFLMAKKFGIKVLEFGFGIPPRMWGKKIGETLFSINWIPYGGFVKLLGEDETDKKVLSNPRSFAYKDVWIRISVVVSGVVMNLILAWILFYIVLFAQNFRIIYPTPEPVVIVAKLQEGFPAEKSGLKVGEKILSIDNQGVNSVEKVRELIKDKAGKEVSVELSDIEGKYKRSVKVTPKKMKNGDVLIGVVFSPLAFRHYQTFSEKLFSGISYSWDLTKLTFIGLGRLFNDLYFGNFEKASSSVAGPVGLAGMTNSILGLGVDAIIPYLWFVGLISLTLSIFNLLPIPALDGGRLLFLIIEAVSGKKVKTEIEGLVHQIGFALLLALAFLITFSDIRKLFP